MVIWLYKTLENEPDHILNKCKVCVGQIQISMCTSVSNEGGSRWLVQSEAYTTEEGKGMLF